MSVSFARKRFGQHFLKDRSVITNIIQALSPKLHDKIVEIGPGLGALTQPLLDYVNHLHVVEIDRDLIVRLRSKFPSNQLQIHEADALQFDFEGLLAQGIPSSSMRLLGNLPYNISTPLLFRLVRFSDTISDMHFMLQKEVVDRMVAMPGTSAYGRLSVMLQYRFIMDRIMDVPPEAFDPMPKVYSSVVRIVPWSKCAHLVLGAGPSVTEMAIRPLIARDESVFEEIVQAAFAHRRKTIHNTLKGIVADAELAGLGIDPGLRAESLPVDCFVKLSNFLVNKINQKDRESL